jgi:hypothetical protein
MVRARAAPRLSPLIRRTSPTTGVAVLFGPPWYGPEACTPALRDPVHVTQRLSHARHHVTELRRGDLPVVQSARLLERQAVMIREFALSFVPGILQTERYARAVLSTSFPPVGEEECDRLVVTRLERAKVLDDQMQPVVWALLDEAVLRRAVGGPGVMSEQIMHIVRLAETGRVRVYVLPFGLGVHPLMQGMLTLLSFEDQPPVAYSEGIQVGKVHDSPAMVYRLVGAYDLALGDAMPLKESLTLMRATAKDYGHRD